MPETHLPTGAEVLPFRRPGQTPGRRDVSARAGLQLRSPPGPSADGDPDNFRHRMMTNLAGLSVAVALILSGIWIAEEMAQLRRDQDCVLMSLKSCRQLAAKPSDLRQ